MTAVIITRPVAATEQAASIYQQAGFDVFKAPMFEIKTNLSVKPQWLELTADVWVILSVNALHHALRVNPKIVVEADTRVIAVGPAVKRAWEQQFDHPISYHPWMNSEGVIELLNEIKPLSVKIFTTGGGREVLKQHCMQNHLSYCQINSYLRLPQAIDVVAVKNLYSDHNKVVLTATSSDILQHFNAQLTVELKALVHAAPLVVGAKRIADLARQLGFEDIHLANSPSDEDMCQQMAFIN